MSNDMVGCLPPPKEKTVKTPQFKRSLEKRGVKITNGDGHWHLRYQGKWTILKRHPAKEISNVHMRNILKQLGLK